MTGEKTVYSFLDELASKAPVPGGGGASALAGALAAALGQMVVNLTVGKKRYQDVEELMQQALSRLNVLQQEFAALADRDAEVFAPLAKAYGMPKETADELAEKERVMEACLLAASLVPLEIMEKTMVMLDILAELGEKGSRLAVSDVGVGVQFARTALLGAVMNVYINTKAMQNRDEADRLNRRADKMVTAGSEQADRIYAAVLQVIYPGGNQ